ncbi:MAG TPA: glycosyltransferase family 39 protein [Candidatus Polarisedimenticolia bacterium]|nr:glycosyltransferase family 39 protein [Candidatus Polarisedimenticolia bacterium]
MDERKRREREKPAVLIRAALIVLIALALRAIYLSLITRTACLDINMDPISDMEAFHRWAMTIVDGDWLGRSDFHPYHPWQIAIAPPEQWAAWYGHVFHQEPVYPYLIALLYLFAPRSPLSVIVAQMVLGSLGCAFVYLAARRLMREGAALWAGILSAIYGPTLYYESLMLRDTFMMPMSALLIWLIVEARRSGGRAARAWWFSAGLVGGLLYATKASVLPFLLLCMLWVLWCGRSGEIAGARKAAALMLAGCVLALTPVVARNIIVGAPPLLTTTRGPVEFINGNNPWHVGVGWFEGDAQSVTTYARGILTRSGGRLLPTMAAVLSDWSSRPGAFLWLQVRKMGYLLAPFEMPNNASYSYFRENSALLRRGLPWFHWISPLALLGLIVSWRRRRLFMPIYLFLAAGGAVTVAFYVIARFRAPFMPAVMMLAGLGLWSILRSARRRRWGRLARSVLLVVAGLSLNTAFGLTDDQLVRPQDYAIAIEGYKARGMMEQALEEADRGRRRFPAFAHFHKAAGFLALELGKRTEALEALEAALARDPSDDETRRAVSRLAETPP